MAEKNPFNCSDWIAHALADAGCTHVYGGHGGALAPLVNAVVNNPRLTWVVTRNEANASLMAAAHAKLTGTLGVCIATSGPGATNLTTGLFDAAMDQVPMIAITGLKPRAGMAYSEFQDFEQSQMFAAGGLVFSHDVAAPEALPPLLRDAVAKALTQRTVVHLAIPVDVQDAPSPLPLRPFCAASARDALSFPSADDKTMDAVAKELQSAGHRGSGRVLIVVGNRCVDAGRMILELAERIRAPILTRQDAKGCCDESHPLVFGVVGIHGKPGMELAAKLIETSQLVVSFGTHDDTVLLCNRAGLQIRSVIHFEPDPACLLFHTRFRSLHTIVGDPLRNIEILLKKLGPEPDSLALLMGKSQMATWTEDVASARMNTEAPDENHYRAAKKQKMETLASEALELWEHIHNEKWKRILQDKSVNAFSRFVIASQCATYKHCHPAAVLREMSAHMTKEDVLCVDTGDVTLWASLCAVLTKGSRTLASERMGTMGYSLCAGIAACLVRQEKGRAVVVAGDGGVQMTINELGTIYQIFANAKLVEYKLLLIIFDNECLGRVLFGFQGSLGCELGPSPDFVAIAKAYGGDGITLREESELKTVMEKAFASTGLFVIHALTDPSIKADMAVIHDNSIKMMNSG